MANSNVNIANKMFTYIRHGCDINDQIKDIYNNSLIFIGDEQQIYVPVMNTYVGIGTTAYTNTLNLINDISDRLNEITNSLSSDIISKVYVDWNLDNRSFLSNGSQDAFESEKDFDNQYALKNEITFRGVHDYDPDTGFSYRVGNKTFKAFGKDGIPHDANGDATTTYSVSNLATSGITITPHWGTEEDKFNEKTQQYIKKQLGNWIEIDDKLTWSYMTSAYAYSMKYAQNYTDTEIDRLYHNLLGESDGTYLPVSLNSVFEDVSDYVNKLSEDEKTNYSPNGKTVLNIGNFYWTIENGRKYYFASYDAVSGIENSDKHYIEISIDDLLNYAKGETTEFNRMFLPSGEEWIMYGDDEGVTLTGLPQIYTFDNVYNSTYNMNIKDGIQTLKEVAYLLDILSDGTLGATTYITYGEWKADSNLSSLTWTDTTDEHGNTIQQASVVGGATYTRINANENPADSENYAFYIVENSPENLGIQIAYSIAGNQKQIEDLHYHIELAESGQTTLRSIQSTNEDFGSIELLGGTVDWVNTDTNNAKEVNINHINNNGNSYLVGDVNIKLNLSTASTYMTVWTGDNGGSNPEYESVFGVVWKGTYTLADPQKLTNNPAAYYFEVPGSPGVFSNEWNDVNDTHTGNPIFIYDPHQKTDAIKYWWIPSGSTNNNTNNTIYKSISLEDWNSTDAGDTLGDTSIIKRSQSDPEMFYKDPNNGDANDDGYVRLSDPVNAGIPIIYFKVGHQEMVEHATLGENKLATTNWVGTYVASNMSELTNNLDNVLVQAYEYTNKKISELNTEYKYSDFETAYWESYVNSNPELQGLSKGSSVYDEAYNREYNDFRDGNHDENGKLPNGTYVLAYQVNSQYTYNIIEENGLVTAEGRELPTDTIHAITKVWGAEENFEVDRHKYTEISGLPSEAPLFEALYAWIKDNDNQIFVETKEICYQPVEPNYEGSLNGLFVYDSDTNTYNDYVQQADDAIDDYSDTDDIKWRQLYRAAHKYVELNLQDADDDKSTNSELHIGDYTLTLNAGTIDVEGPDVPGEGEHPKTKLLYISSSPEHKVEYLTTESKHYSYLENGHGENELTVTAHITKLEDATSENSGFADAFDVKTYIDNLIKFIDISATAPASLVNTSSKYHKRVSFAYYTEFIKDNTYLSAAEKDIYTLNGSTYECLTNDPTVGYFWADTNEFYANTWNGTQPNNSGHTMINGTYIKPEYMRTTTTDDYNPETHDYFVRIEFAKNNAQNLTETEYK